VNISNSARAVLLGDLLAAEVQRENGVTKNTRDKEARVWRRWLEYTNIIEFDHDIWLESLLPENRARLMGAFAAALQRRQFSHPVKKDLAAGTVQETMAKLGEIFRANEGYNTTHGVGNHGFHPSLLPMRNEDPGEVQQKALPVFVYRELYRVAQLLPPEISHLDCTIAWLQTLVFFWCMRSCEYSGMQEEHRTKILCMRNFRFFDTHNIDMSANTDVLLERAVMVSITFEFQKRDIRNNTILHQRSGDKLRKGEMCPVRAAVEIALKIHSYQLPQDKFREAPINFDHLGSLSYTIPSSRILVKIRAAVRTLGPDKLGFDPDKGGTHSNRSGSAMGMLLARAPVYTIMLMGRWTSDAFMRYLRKQVISLSHGIATKMLTFEESDTIPDFIHTSANGNPRARNNTSLATTQSFNGTHANMRH